MVPISALAHGLHIAGPTHSTDKHIHIFGDCYSLRLVNSERYSAFPVSR